MLRYLPTFLPFDLRSLNVVCTSRSVSSSWTLGISFRAFSSLSHNRIKANTDYVITARVTRVSDNTTYDLTYDVSIGP